MKARVRELILAVAMASLTVGTVAAQETRTHRSRAGTFTSNTWALAESTGGRYSVLMPAPFDDYTQKSNNSDSRQGYFLKTKLPDETVLAAMRVEYADAATATRNCLRARDGQPFVAGVKSRRVFEVDGHIAVDLTTQDGRVWMAMRVICLETEGVILSVVALQDRIPQAQALASKFFDSLQIRKE